MAENSGLTRYGSNADGLHVHLVAASPTGVEIRTGVVLHVRADGTILAFNGHVDLGTGIRTALSQIVADELDVEIENVEMALGDVRFGPDQGATLASTTIQVTAVPLRKAAAQARHWLVAEASVILDCAIDDLRTHSGQVISASGGNRSASYAEILSGRSVHLDLDPATPTKKQEDYRLVGKSVPRSDIPLKATGEFTFVHDVRVEGMVHGRVVRPPYAGVDNGPFVGTSLLEVVDSSVRHVPTLIAVVTVGDFVGVIAEREEDAIRAANDLKVVWRDIPDLPDLSDIEAALRTNQSRRRNLAAKGDVAKALSEGRSHTKHTYVWPYQMHGSIGPSCAIADVSSDSATVWSGTQNPHWLQADIATLLDLPVERVSVIRREAAGCYGRNCADDVTADAALLSRAVGRPVRVQLSREQEHAWEPKGPASLIDVEGCLGAEGEVSAYRFENWWPGNRAPTLALLLTGRIPPTFEFGESGDRTAIPPYDYPNVEVSVNDSRPIVRASWFRGVASLPNTFAHESFIDEMAYKARADPVEYRLRHLKDSRGVELVKAVATRAGWTPHTSPTMAEKDGILRGRGFAYALYVHSKFPGFGAAWSAWVADVEVNRETGEVSVKRVTVGQDSGLMINPAGVRHQLHGNVIQATSRALMEEVRFDSKKVTSREWGSYPIITFEDIPEINPLLVPRPEQPPLGAGESATVPSAAAIANAIFDATGVRFREVPFSPERIKRGLDEAAKRQSRPRKGLVAAIFGVGATTAAFLSALSWQSAFAPIGRSTAASYPSEMVARGAELAAIGACGFCHMGPQGVPFAGGRKIDTGFGSVYSTNITPDMTTGIGSWSYAAFERAMRHGVHRDGYRLYPAFPYTSYAMLADSDMQALYAYLMTREPVALQPPAPEMRFPFDHRILLAGWNAMFHRPKPYESDPNRSDLWNRGAYLVNGLGHCGACHTPRNLLGAEKSGSYHLIGGRVNGWEAPALTSLNKAPIAWTEDALFGYLRHGFSEAHGVASGPMAAVIAELRGAPDRDLYAMANYLSSLNPPTTSEEAESIRIRLESDATRSPSARLTEGGRIFDGACAVCHRQTAAGVAFGARTPLSLSTKLHSDRPDNLIRIIMDGSSLPGSAHRGVMPAFHGSLDDRALAELVRYMRQTFASQKSPWDDIDGAIRHARADD